MMKLSARVSCKVIIVLTMTSLLTATSGNAQQQEFSAVIGWAKLPPGWKFSQKVSGIAVDSGGRVYVADRGPHPIIYFDETGKFQGTIGDKEIRPSIYYDLTTTPSTPQEERPWVHGLFVDSWDNIWVTDVGRHVVMKFSRKGKLLLTLGTLDQPGESPTHFNQPTAVLVAPSGSIYVADGYGNSRIVRFSPEGKYQSSWGKRGVGQGEFHTPHAMTMDDKGNLYVTDRENFRIQVFDHEGRFLAVWPNLPSIDAIFIKGKYLYAGAGTDNQIIKFDLAGRRLNAWGGGSVFGYPHGIWLDREGNLYIAEVAAGRASKYRAVKR